MKLRMKTRALQLCTGLILMGVLAGCQPQDVLPKDKITAKTSEEKPVAFTSEDGSVSIKLPGESWKTDENTENLCMFSSNEGIIMLTKTTDGEIVTPKSEEDIKKILQKEGYNSKNYDVIEYTDEQIANMSSYRSVIKYEDESSPYIYGVLYGTVIDNREYMACAMLYADSEELLEQMKTSIYSFKVLKDKEVLQPEKAAETPLATPAPTPEATPLPTPEATPEPTPEVTLEATMEPTPEADPVPPPEPQANPNPVLGSKTCISSAYIRSGPDNQSPIIGTVSESEVISVTGEIRNWYEINYGGILGYVCKDYVG